MRTTTTQEVLQSGMGTYAMDEVVPFLGRRRRRFPFRIGAPAVSGEGKCAE